MQVVIHSPIYLHFSYRIGISTASKIVEEVCTAIWCLMREDIITPTREIWELIASGFENRANFPNCLGAVDGKHIRLTCPINSGSMYFKNKGYNYIVLMAVEDSKYRFVYIDIGSYGKDCDSAVFKRSSLWKSIENYEQQLPEPKSLPGIDSPKLPYFFIGDEAFGLHKHYYCNISKNILTKQIFFLVIKNIKFWVKFY